MLAYSHPLVTKAAFLAELAWHREQDKITKGTYWDDGRGCAVGCSLNSVRRLTKKRPKRHEHAAYETYLGVPASIAELEDTIFESLPIKQALLWPERFANAIQEGADLSGIVDAFLARLLREIALPTLRPEDDAVRATVERVAAGYATACCVARAAAMACSWDAISDILCECLAASPVTPEGAV